MCNLRARLAWLLATVFPCMVMHASFAHEGHRALPTRGMEVDAAAGKMLLTRSACETLDVQTVELKTEPITRTITAFGSLITPWNQHALVSAPFAGRIVELHFLSGEMVKKGQVLAELECSALEQLQLELRTAQIEFELSSRLSKSTESASRTGAIAGMRFIEAQAKLQQDLAAREIAIAKWHSLRLPQETLDQIIENPRKEHRQRLALASPIDGIVTHTDLSVGKFVDVKEHLLEVLDLSTVWLRISLLEKDISSVRVGQAIELSLTATPSQAIKGVVDVVDRFLDPQTHVATAWATLANPSQSPAVLLPGMSGQVRIHAIQPERKLVVPLSAILRDGAERFVLVEAESTQAVSMYQKQTVVLGQRSGEVFEVRGGNLFPGDRVVTRGSHELGAFFAKGVLHVSPETARDIGLAIEPVVVRQIAKSVAIDGVLDLPPTHRAAVTSQLSGTIERILVDRGQQVRRGDVIAELVSQEFQDLQLELLRIELAASLQQTTLENLRSARTGISERQFLESESQLNQTRSRLDNVLKRLRFSGLNDSQIAELTTSRKLMTTLPVIAPIAGTLVRFEKFLGHSVQPAEAIFEIHDISQAAVQGFISERDLPWLRVGQIARCRFVAAPNEIVRGTLVRSGQQVADNDRTLSVWIELDHPPAFAIQHNMLARVTIDTGVAYDGLAVPRDAIIREGMRTYVFVQQEDLTFDRRLVSIGAADDSFIAIKQGLTMGEQIAVRGALELQSGYAALK